MTGPRDLARESLRSYADAVAPDILGLRSRIDGPLGMALINGMEASEKQRTANHELVENFVKLLPPVEVVGRKGVIGGGPLGFTTPEQSHAMLLQASILWAKNERQYKRPGITTYGDEIWPFYVMGQRHNGSTRSLLLVAANKKREYMASDERPVHTEGIMQSRTYSSEVVDLYEATVQRNLGQLYTPAELATYQASTRFYDKETKTFNVTSSSPGSFSADHLPIPVPEPSGILSVIWNRKQEPRYEAGSIRHFPTFTPQLPSETFLSHDVLGGMSRLATRFGVVDQADALLASTPALELGR